MERKDKINYYLDIADAALKNATCLRRKFGAVIVKDDQIISTGYCGAPRGRTNCSTLGKCKRQTQNIPSGERYELCRSVHAEQNAIISAGRLNCIGSTLYLSGRDATSNQLIGESIDCCMMCKRVVINSGIKEVIMKTGDTTYKIIQVQKWIDEDD